MDGLVSRSGKMLSTFEFWLECKGKTLLGVVNKFIFSVQYKADTKKNMIFLVFSVALMAQKFKSLLHYRI